MAKGHSYLWRKPGRRDKERKRFSALMRKVEAMRLRSGLNKTMLARELETTTDAIHQWMSGRSVDRKKTIEKLKRFLERNSRE